MVRWSPVINCKSTRGTGSGGWGRQGSLRRGAGMQWPPHPTTSTSTKSGEPRDSAETSDKETDSFIINFK